METGGQAYFDALRAAAPAIPNVKDYADILADLAVRRSLIRIGEDIVNTEFNIGAKDFTTMREDYQAVLDRAGYGKKIKGMPVKPLVAILRVLEKLHLSPLYPWVYETASTDSFVSIEKGEKLLGFKPKFSNKQALVRNYDWYVANLDSFKGKTGVSHRVPWKQGLLAFAKWFF
jgi:nucleoside-diphosphate-sugar epimerase